VRIVKSTLWERLWGHLGVPLRGLRALVRFLYETGDTYGRNQNGPRAASLAFFGFLSLFPLLLLLVATASIWIDDVEARNRVLEQLSAYLLPAAVDLVRDNLETVLRIRGTVTLVAGVGLLYSASGFFASLAGGLDRIWVEESGRRFYTHRLLAFLLVVGVIVAFALTSVLNAALGILPALIEEVVPGVAAFLAAVWQYVVRAVLLMLDIGMIAVLYRMVPSERPPWRDVLPAAALAAVGLNVLKWGFSLYIAQFARYGFVYGTLSTIVVLLLWVYFSAIVFLFCAELGASFMRRSRVDSSSAPAACAGGSPAAGGTDEERRAGLWE